MFLKRRAKSIFKIVATSLYVLSLFCCTLFADFAENKTFTGKNLILSAVETSPDNYTVDLTNYYVGAIAFYENGIYGQNTKVANIEGGVAWLESSFFADSTIGELWIPEGKTEQDLYDGHATMTSNIISGYISDNSNNIKFYLAYGIAPLSELSRGGIASKILENNKFNIEDADFCKAYLHYFGTSDVINSSWGPLATSANSYVKEYIDALAYANTKTTMVFAAGNEGPTLNTVSSIAQSYNSISVGALDNPFEYDQIADYSSRGASDFYNPISGEVIQNVRASVHITAPGSNIVGAYYDKTEPNADDYLITNGTSFAAPIVSGVVSLLKSTSYELEANQSFIDAGWNDTARDTRVIKAVILNSASKPTDWNNGQSLQDNVELKIEFGTGSYYTSTFNNVIVTNQALDYNYGAGILDGQAALNQYIGMYTNGNALNVWLTNDVDIYSSQMYRLGSYRAEDIITATLVWMVQSELVENAENADIPDISKYAFANLDLELWILCDGTYIPVAVSKTQYDTVEHLCVALSDDGEYYIRVSYFENIYGNLEKETYALAWSVQVPEPAFAAAFMSIFAIIFAFGKFRYGSVRRKER